MNSLIRELVSVGTKFHVWCFSHHHADGEKCLTPWACPQGLSLDEHEHRLRWKELGRNLVVTLGRNALLDNTFNAAAGSVNWYVGLKDTGTVVAADTMASHAGWAELTIYSNATRPAWTKNGAASAGAMSNSSSKASFNINATDDVYGALMSSDSTKGGTTGTLYGAGDFTAPRGVISGDTLNIQVDLSITAS